MPLPKLSTLALLLATPILYAQTPLLDPPAKPDSTHTSIQLELLTDTQGANLNPYLGALVLTTREHWLTRLAQADVHPEAPKSTLIRLTIAPDGSISAMHLDSSTHDVTYDKAAWSALIATGHFASLPAALPKLELRARFEVPADPAH